jgi:hypothetical protein
MTLLLLFRSLSLSLTLVRTAQVGPSCLPADSTSRTFLAELTTMVTAADSSNAEWRRKLRLRRSATPASLVIDPKVCAAAVRAVNLLRTVVPDRRVYVFRAGLRYAVWDPISKDATIDGSGPRMLMFFTPEWRYLSSATY